MKEEEEDSLKEKEYEHFFTVGRGQRKNFSNYSTNLTGKETVEKVPKEGEQPESD